MTLTVHDNLIRSVDGRVKFRVLHAGGREHYHVGVWIDGSDTELDRIERVTYLLHPTFTPRERSSANRRNKFSVTFWTWGLFEIAVTVHLVGGGTQSLTHALRLELPPDDPANYVEMK